jgi:hypothetical protein
VAGGLVDYRRGAAHPGEWVEAQPRTSAWTGGVPNDVRYEVAAYRCAGCGLLRLFAGALATAPKHA